MYKRYVVRLTDQERSQLQTLVRRGRAHARILLKADADGPDRWADERIAQAFEVSAAMVARERRRFCEDGLEVVLMPRKPGRPRRKVLDGRAEAHLQDKPRVGAGTGAGHAGPPAGRLVAHAVQAKPHNQ